MFKSAAAALLLATPALAAEPGIVTTQATARDRLPNTVADVTLQIEARSRALADVQRTLATNSANLTAYLKTTGATRTSTQAVTVQPETDDNPARGQPARIVGYDGTVTLSFRIDADQLGAVLGGALGHGANSIQATTLHPRQEDMDAKRQDLASQATRQALADARAVAEAAGRHLGAAMSLRVDDAAPTSDVAFARAAPRPSPSTAAGLPIATASGDTEISAAVTVTMALIKPDPAPR